MITGIVVALKEELITLTASKIAKGCVGQINNTTLVICSGAGIDNARIAAELLVKQGASQLISWGCAAALDASFKPGDLVLANCCVDADFAVIGLDNQGWINAIKAKLAKPLAQRTYTGKLAESKSIVASSEDKATLATATGAIAVDMESFAIAKVAQAHRLPFLPVRAIADPRTMDLPKAVSHGLNDQGEVELCKLLLYLLWHPTELPGLIALGLHFSAAQKTLKEVAKQLDVVTMPYQHALNPIKTNA